MSTVAYLRASTSKQNLGHQKKSIEDFAKKNNMEISKYYSEHISAYNTSIEDRKQLQNLLNLVKSNKVNNVIVFELSRLSRKFKDGIEILNTFIKHNVRLWIVKDNRLIENIIEQDVMMELYNTEKESENISARCKSQKSYNKEQGRYLGGKILDGFKVVDGFEIIDEDKKQEVIDMFDDYINYGARYTIEKYNFSHHQILLQKLKNKKYIKIIGEAKFNQVQKLIKSRTTARKGNTTRSTNKTDVIYEGLLYHVCGRKLVIDRNKKGLPFFRCKKCKGDSTIKVKKSFKGIPLMNNMDKEIINYLNTLDKNNLPSICLKLLDISNIEKSYNSLENLDKKAILCSIIDKVIVRDINDFTIYYKI